MRCNLLDRCVLTPRDVSCKQLYSCDRKLAKALYKLYRPARAGTRPGTAGILGNSRFNAPQQHDRLAASLEQETVTSSDGDEDKTFAENIWQPVPPTPALGRKRKVALLLGCAMLEISVTGGLMWAPLLGAIALAMLQPTKAEIAQQQEAAVQQAVTAARIRMSRELPVTPVESVAWLNRLMQEMWVTFWQPFLLANNLNMWQDTVSAAAPRGWEVEIADISIGTLAPELTDFQAYADPDSGTVTALDCKMLYDSTDVRFVVVGRGPLGAFTARVSAVQMAGQMRITPLLQHRMLLFAFKEQPNVRVSLSISAPLFKTALSPGDLGQLDFIQGLLGAAIKDMLVEPRRMAISLDTDIRVEEAVATTLHLTVDTISGLPPAALGQPGSSSATVHDGGGRDASSGSAAARRKSREHSPRIALIAVDTLTQVSRSTVAVSHPPTHRSAAVRQDLSLDLPRKQGLFRLEARDMSRGSKGALLGSCLLWVAAARDGTTLFWSHDRSGAPLATRWAPSDIPWRITLSMTASPASSTPAAAAAAGALSVDLGVSVEPWVYKARVPGVVGQRSVPPRVVVLQVVEARGLSLPASSAHSHHHQLLPSTHIQVCYDQECYSTSTTYNSSSPVFDELFAFQENPGMLTRRVKLEVWHDGPAPAAAHSNGSSSKSGSSGSGKGFGKRVSSGFSSGSSRAFKSLGLVKGSAKGSRSTKGAAGSSSSSSSKVLSHKLSDISEEPEGSAQSGNDDVSSHMLFDVELEDDQPVEAEGPTQQQLQQQQQGGELDDSSSSVSLGSAVVNLDQLTESTIQDRWFALSGSDGGEVRLRMTVVPGSLPHSQKHNRKHHHHHHHHDSTAAGGAGSSDDVCELLSFFHKSLQGNSRDSLLVEVVSARLYLPLSSLDSSDVDQPAYMLQYNGSSTITLPPYLQPMYQQQQQQQQRSKSPKLIGGGGSSKSRSSSRASGSSSKQPAASSTSSHLFDNVIQGNVSAQVNMQYCLSRAVFPVAAAAAAQQPALPPPGSNTSSSSGGGVETTPSGVSDSTGAPAAAATATAADGMPGSGPSATATAVAARPKLKISLLDSDDITGNLSSVATAAANSDNSGLGDIGSAEVDVMQLLQQSGVSLNGNESTGGMSPAPGAAAAASWDGWVKLDKDGGHLLLRLTQLPASEPADLAPPPSAATLAHSAATSNPDGSGKPPVSAAAAAAAAAMSGAKGGGSGGSSEADDGGRGGGLSRFVTIPSNVKQVIKKGYTDAESQVTGAVSQLSDAAGSWWNSSSSTVGGWISNLPSWAKVGSSSSSSKADEDKSQQQRELKEHRRDEDKDRRDIAVQQQEQQKHQERTQGQHQQQQQQPDGVLSSVDLTAIARSWGWPPHDDKQQQQQQQRGSSSQVSKPEQQQQQKQQQQVLTSQSKQPSSGDDNGGISTGHHSGVSGIMAAIGDALNIKPKSAATQPGHKQHQQPARSEAKRLQQQKPPSSPQVQQQSQPQQQSPVQRQTILLSPTESKNGIMHSSSSSMNGSIDGSSSSNKGSPTANKDADGALPAQRSAAASEPTHRQPVAASSGDKVEDRTLSQSGSSLDSRDGSRGGAVSSDNAAPSGHRRVAVSSPQAKNGTSNGNNDGRKADRDLQQQQPQPGEPVSVPAARQNAGAAAVGAAESAAASVGSHPLQAAALHSMASSMMGMNVDDDVAAAADGSAVGAGYATVWSYDGDGDEEQRVVEQSSGWEAGQEHSQGEF